MSEDRTVNFTARLRPELLTINQSDNALVVDSVSFVAQPLSVFEPMDFSVDGLARLVVFAKNLEQVNSTSQLVLTAQDELNLVYPLPVEYVGNVAGQSWLKQINVRILPSLVPGKCFRLRVIVDKLESNPARVCFAATKAGS